MSVTCPAGAHLDLLLRATPLVHALAPLLAEPLSCAAAAFDLSAHGAAAELHAIPAAPAPPTAAHQLRALAALRPARPSGGDDGAPSGAAETRCAAVQLWALILESVPRLRTALCGCVLRAHNAPPGGGRGGGGREGGVHWLHVLGACLAARSPVALRLAAAALLLRLADGAGAEEARSFDEVFYASAADAAVRSDSGRMAARLRARGKRPPRGWGWSQTRRLAPSCRQRSRPRPSDRRFLPLSGPRASAPAPARRAATAMAMAVTMTLRVAPTSAAATALLARLRRRQPGVMETAPLPSRVSHRPVQCSRRVWSTSLRS